MKRFLSLTLILLVLGCLLGGCHGAREELAFAVPEEFDTSRDYEITFWAKNDTNNTQVAIYKQAIADFQRLYPNITVNLRLYTDYGRIYNDVITNIATGTTPNVCITYPDHIATYLTGDSVVALDQLLADPRYGLGGSALPYDGPDQGEILPKFLEECRIGGYTYALPYMRSTEVCYVNKTFVEALGFTLPQELTWEFVWEVSDAATAKNPDGTYRLNGQQVLIPFLYKSTDNMMIQYLNQAGSGYSTAGGQVELFNDTTGAFLQDIARHTKTGAFSTFKISGYPANFLNAGQCIFAVDSTAGATWMGPDAPLVDIPQDKLMDFEIAVMKIPQVDPESPKMISQGPSLCVFQKADDQEVLASWLFAQYLLTNDVQISYAQTEGYVPVTAKAQQSQTYQDYLAAAGTDTDLHYQVKMDATRLLLDNIDNTFVTPVFNGSASLRDSAGYLIENVTKSVRRNAQVDDAYLTQLYQDTTSLYRLDQITGSGGKQDLGPLPGESVALLSCLALAWVGIALYWFSRKRA